MVIALVRSCAVLIVRAGGSAAQEFVLIGDVPLPEEAVSSPPGDGVSFGTWVGQWDNQRNHILVIESLGKDAQASVIYAVGPDENGRGRWFRRTAKIDGDALFFCRWRLFRLLLDVTLWPDAGRLCRHQGLCGP